jgi:phosphate transport system substrate-binding protein
VQSPTELGKYVLVAALGRGGMADVHLAVARGVAGFQKLVVIKRLRADVANDPSFHQLLLEEARLAARLQHGNVVQTFEVGEIDGRGFIAMEYLDGQPLHRVFTAGATLGMPMSPATTLTIVSELLGGLHYAHDLSDYDGRPLDIVHRDVSPQNVFLTYDGEVKLVDFGIAKAKLAVGNGAQTEVGILKGKVAYMAPEQIHSAVVDRRTDVFAAGIVLWELLTKRRLFASPGSTTATLQAVLAADIVPPSSFAAVGRDVDDLVMRALARPPEQRFQTAREMRDATERVLEKMGGRVRKDDLAVYVRGLFTAERARSQETVRAAMAMIATLPPSLPPASDMSTAGSRVPFPVSAPPPMPMPVTTQPLPPSPSSPLRAVAIAAAGVAAVVVIAGVVGFAARNRRQTNVDARAPASSSAAVVAAPVPRAYVLRLHGSNTIGAELVPALVEGFYKQRGAVDVSRRAGDKPQQLTVQATMPGKASPDVVEISAEGTATGFDALGRGACDVAMASRAVNDDEAAKLSALGDMRTAANEHVVALDGIAVVVHPNNRVSSLDAAAVAKLFSGETHDWSEVGGKAGPITVYARDDASGTYDSFKHLVLGKRPLLGSAKRFPASDALSDAVARDPGGIGFVGLAYTRSAKPIAIGAQGVAPMMPSAFTVTTEGYLLSRRLYLYTADKASDTALAFVTFALSPEGQKIVRAAGFVDLDVALKDKEPCGARCSPRYADVVKRARRLSLDFRFKKGTAELDTRGKRDLDRVVAFLRGRPSAKLLLLGFADSSGDPADNMKLSKDRAKQVSSELALRGVRAGVVDGFGAESPVASNGDEAGREKNRRVEVWLEE